MTPGKPPTYTVALRSGTKTDVLEQILVQRVAPSSTRGRDGLTPARLQSAWKATAPFVRDSLRAGTYPFSGYLQTVVSKGASKLPRELSIPTARDRVALRAILHALQACSPRTMPETAQTKVGRLAQELSLGRYDAFVRVDIVGFYDNVNHSILESKLQSLLRSAVQVTQLMRAVESPTVARDSSASGRTNSLGVPQGLAISGFLGELYLEGFDQNFGARSDLAYFRFVDDIVILCGADKAQELWGAVNHELCRLGLTAHPLTDQSKSQLGLTAEGFDYLGYKFRGTSVSVREQNVRKLERSLARIFTQYRYAVHGPPRAGFNSVEWPDVCDEILVTRLNLLITGCTFEGKRRGWLTYFLRIDDESLLKKLDLLIVEHRRHFRVPGHLRLKSFVRAYWSWRSAPTSPRRRYLPDFDNLTEGEMRRYLRRLFLISGARVASMTPDEVARVFRQRMNKIVQELERDTTETS